MVATGNRWTKGDLLVRSDEIPQANGVSEISYGGGVVVERMGVICRWYSVTRHLRLAMGRFIECTTTSVRATTFKRKRMNRKSSFGSFWFVLLHLCSPLLILVHFSSSLLISFNLRSSCFMLHGRSWFILAHLCSCCLADHGLSWFILVHLGSFSMTDLGSFWFIFAHLA